MSSRSLRSVSRDIEARLLLTIFHLQQGANISLLLQQKMNLMVSKRKRVYTTLLSRRACLYQAEVRSFHLQTDVARTCEIVLPGPYRILMKCDPTDARRRRSISATCFELT